MGSARDARVKGAYNSAYFNRVTFILDCILISGHKIIISVLSKVDTKGEQPCQQKEPIKTTQKNSKEHL